MAMPMAITSTASRKSSRDRVTAIRSRTQGMTHRPSITTAATRPMILRRVMAMADTAPPPVPPLPENRMGSIRRYMTVRISSMTVQPMAMCPIGAWRSRRSARTKAITTVLATEIARPRTIPGPHSQPSVRSSAARAAVEKALWIREPGTAIRHTAASSRR